MITIQRYLLTAVVVLTWSPVLVTAQDWVQWRGNNRDGAASDFKAPDKWPESLVKKWSVEVGNGVSSPSVKGDKVYVIAFQDGNEVMRCLNAENGEEIWKDEYKAQPASGPAASFPGTRSAPAIGEDHVVALGVNGTVSCWNAESGEKVWRNDDNQGKVPRFSTSSSPIIADGLCIVEFGTDQQGGIVAYDLKSGDEKWKWSKSGASYGSPVLMTVGKHQVVLAPAANKLVAVSIADGKELWSMDYTQGRYNAATPVVDGQTAYIAGPERGITALKFSDDGDKLSSEEIWRNEDTETTVMYNSPVLLDGKLFGLSNANQLFCVKVDSGEMAWNQTLTSAEAESAPSQGRGGQGDQGERQRPQRGGEGRPERGGQDRPQGGEGRPDRSGGRFGGRGGRGGRGGGGRGGYGSIVSVGPVLLGLTPSAELIVYQSSGDEFKELARYKVSETKTYAYPIPVGDRIYVKDDNNLTMWSLK